MDKLSRYIFVDHLRYLKPYTHSYSTYAKGRWLGKKLLDVFATEFKSKPREYYINAIKE